MSKSSESIDQQKSESPDSSSTMKSITMKSITRTVFRLVRLPVLAYLFVVLGLMFFEESLIFQPSRYPDGYWNPPGLTFEDAWFEAEDGTKLHGWYVQHEAPKAVILMAHGNAGNLSGRAPVVRWLHDKMEVSVMIFDYRGYGRSEGKPNEAGLLQDARAARAWLATKAGISEKEIVLMGRSLGGGVMVDLAAKDGARGLILQSTFTSMPDVAGKIYPFIPVHLVMRTRFDSLSIMKDYQGPLLQSHGDSDGLIPMSMGKQLFDAANEPKEFFVIQGGDHNDPQPPEYEQVLKDFLNRLNEVE